MPEKLIIFPPLPRTEVIKAVERKSPARIPLIQAKWWGEGFVERHGDALGRFNRFPEDVTFIWIEPIHYSQNPAYSANSLMQEQL